MFCSLAYTIAKQVFGFNDGYINFSTGDASVANTMFVWASQNYGYTNIIVAFLVTGCLRLFFGRYAFGFFETLVMMFFITGNSMIYLSMFGALDAVFKRPIIDVGGLVISIYTVWAIAQCYDGRRIANYIFALFSYFMGLIVFTLTVLAIGSIGSFAQTA